MPNRWHALVARLAPGARLVDHRPLHGGVSATSTLLAYTTPEGTRARAVIRVEGDRSFKDGDRPGPGRQARLLAALAGTGVPVPVPLDADDAGTHLGAPWLATTFIEGDSTLPPGGPAVLGALLATLHDLPLAGLPELPRRQDPGPELATYALAHAWRARRDAPGAPALLHGDFWPGNVLWRGGRVVALVDWEDAALGDPHADLATARVELLAAAGPAAVDAFTAAYAARRPLDALRLSAWEVLAAAASLASMDAWGLSPEALEHRRRLTREALARAAAVGP